ncbi:VCBS repeat-containing protein [Nostoc sp. FACHB-110]|uniref:FG-GAP repeat domain-containing protein n=1 Tax=Nostoc sp. FACHB-110 TaxID=2692834 RepID=UPI0016844F33|nr:VCBS repeat-containing protein [Nostoc sp. FACHB-110]MBD2437756.1 VCBS repeat-containing protein [Nostoc sp. FACHB-110]
MLRQTLLSVSGVTLCVALIISSLIKSLHAQQVGYTFAGLADWDGDGRQDIVARDNTTGLLWLYPGDRTRGYSSQARVQIGNGWNTYTFAGLADWDGDGRQDIVARDNTTGLLWLYPGDRKRGYSSQARVQIGNGWNTYTFAGLADWDGDGRQDIVARDNTTRLLWLYPGDRTRGYSSQARVQIGNGW